MAIRLRLPYLMHSAPTSVVWREQLVDEVPQTGPSTSEISVEAVAPGCRFLEQGPSLSEEQNDAEVLVFNVEDAAVTSNPFQRLHVFACFAELMNLFEDATGARPRWRDIDRPLKIALTRGGRFAWFDQERQQIRLSTRRGTGRIPKIEYAALRPDVIFHELGHAVLSGLLPVLRHTELHEDFASIVAVAGMLNHMSQEKADLTANLVRQEWGRRTSEDCPQYPTPENKASVALRQLENDVFNTRLLHSSKSLKLLAQDLISAACKTIAELRGSMHVKS